MSCRGAINIMLDSSASQLNALRSYLGGKSQLRERNHYEKKKKKINEQRVVIAFEPYSISGIDCFPQCKKLLLLKRIMSGVRKVLSLSVSNRINSISKTSF